MVFLKQTEPDFPYPLDAIREFYLLDENAALDTSATITTLTLIAIRFTLWLWKRGLASRRTFKLLTSRDKQDLPVRDVKRKPSILA